jgi:two component transcriptional regulator, winged helix family
MSVDKNKRKDFIKAPRNHFYFITLLQFNKEIFKNEMESDLIEFRIKKRNV